MTDPVAKPVTTFPRSYVVERIEARMASLKSRVKQAEADSAALLVKQAKSDRTWLAGFVNKAHDIQVQISSAGPLDDVELVEQTHRIEDAISKLRDRPAQSYDDRQKLTFLLKQSTEFEREIESLEHAVAYLRGTPIEQFSITALRQLGLLDVVKFSLDIAVKK